MTRALLVDLDGVLRRRDPRVVHGCEEEAGLPAGSILAAAFEPNLLTAAVTGRITQNQWENAVIMELSGRHPDADTRPAVRRCLGDVGHLDPEVLAVVDAVRPHATVCLVSNATSRLHADLEALGLTDHVDHVVSSADLGVTKPDPRVLVAAARLSGAPPEHCLVVDDAAGVTAAAEDVGMTGHTFTATTALEQAVEHWLTREAPGGRATGALCLDPDDRVLLVQRQDPVSGDLLWEPPGGQNDAVRRYLDVRWWTWNEVLGARERIEPAELASLLRATAPSGPWRSAGRIAGDALQ
ncbi:HAD-IA family hydrolase [Lentzea tibetensis]|uniref:HAD-IA family hydrolase n=1 Tax=Lentzea tibetensis TaxID=2591470 RepID=UPI001648F52F|nr:HAD-IA family hydrolase [Lentzea tibetensis]